MRGSPGERGRTVTQSAPEAPPEREVLLLVTSRTSITWLPFFPSPSFTLQLELPPSQSRACTLKEVKPEIHLYVIHVAQSWAFRRKPTWISHWDSYTPGAGVALCVVVFMCGTSSQTLRKRCIWWSPPCCSYIHAACMVVKAGAKSFLPGIFHTALYTSVCLHFTVEN